MDRVFMTERYNIFWVPYLKHVREPIASAKAADPKNPKTCSSDAWPDLPRSSQARSLQSKKGVNPPPI
jgi:hypothetical protein